MQDIYFKKMYTDPKGNYYEEIPSTLDPEVFTITYVALCQTCGYEVAIYHEEPFCFCECLTKD